MRMLIPAILCVFLAPIQAPEANASEEPLLAATMPADQAINLYEVNGAKLRLTKSIAIGKEPGRLCTDPSGSTLYAITASGAAAIDLQTQRVTGNFGDAEVKAPYGCLVSPDGKKLYVTDAEASLVFVFSTETRGLLKRIAVPDDPRHGIYTPGHKLLVFSCGDANALAVVDPSTDSLMRTVKTVGLDPRSMVITPDGRYLVVALVSSDILSWFRADTLEPTHSFGVTRSPQGLVASADGSRLYASGVYEGLIAVIDARHKKGDGTPQPRQTSAIPVGPAYSLAASADGDYLYAAPTNGIGTIVDLRSWQVSRPAALKGAGSVLYIGAD